MTTLSTGASRREPSVERHELTLESASGNALRATLTEAWPVRHKTGIILCPGLAVGKEGHFVRSAEQAIFGAGLARWSIRYNVSGHALDDLNSDLRGPTDPESAAKGYPRGFTFTNALQDFRTCVHALRARGAERVIAITSSTGTQAPLLEACTEAPCIDGLVGRSSIVDLFRSKLAALPRTVVDGWKAAGSFKFPVGGLEVTLGSALIHDIESYGLEALLPKLARRAAFLHGSADAIAPLTVLKDTLAMAPSGLAKVTEIPGGDHGLSNTELLSTQWTVNAVKMLLSKG